MKLRKFLLNLGIGLTFSFSIFLAPQQVTATTKYRDTQMTDLAEKAKSETTSEPILKKLGSVIGLVVVLSGFSLLFIKKRRVNEEEEEP